MEYLRLNGVKSCSSLHDACKLKMLEVTCVTRECFDALQQSRCALLNCRLYVFRCPWFNHLQFDLQTQQVTVDLSENFAANFAESDLSLDTFPALETLWVKNNNQTIININHSPRLDFLGIFNPNVQFKFGPRFACFNVSMLVLASLSTESVITFLSFCPYLRALTVINAKKSVSLVAFESLLASQKSITLDISTHLASLQLINVEGFYSLLPRLPRLASLALEEVGDFSMTSMERFPILSVVNLCRVTITDRPSKPNYCTIFLRLFRCTIKCFDFLLSFERLSFLSLIFPKVFVDYLIVPHSLRTAQLYLSERYALINCFSHIQSVKCYFQVKSDVIRNEVDCLLTVFKRQFSKVGVTACVEDHLDVPLWFLSSSHRDPDFLELLHESTVKLLET
ncbi:hypothetical protein RCL1_003010 [Eukaryota sp. TZLM3-RCL]